MTWSISSRDGWRCSRATCRTPTRRCALTSRTRCTWPTIRSLALSLLQPLLTDQDPDVAQAAEHAVGRCESTGKPLAA